MSPKGRKTTTMPDDLNREWTEFESRWAVDVSDFPSVDEAAEFLSKRKKFFKAAQEAGFPRELLSAFAPNKPGFEDRARKALAKLNKSMGWAAE